MTYFKEVGIRGPLAHTGVLPDLYCCLWVHDTVISNTSCHSCYKAKYRHYDYLHSTTLSHLKAPNSNLKRVFTHYCHLPQPVDFWPWANIFFGIFVPMVPVPLPDWKNTDTITIRHTHICQKYCTIILYKLYYILLLTC